MFSGDLVFAVALLSTVAMAGLMWFVQMIHYPLIVRVGQLASKLGKASETAAALEHTTRTLPRAIFMLVTELGSGLALLFVRPPAVPVWLVFVSLLPLIPIWYWTWGTCVPLHLALCERFNQRYGDRLLTVNLWRCVCWSARALCLIAALLRVLDSARHQR